MKARLPDAYRPQEIRRSRREREIMEEAIVYTSELAMATIANLLIEKHGWGTGKSATRLRELMDDFERAINEDGRRYGYDFVYAAQTKRLREHGINLRMR